MQNMKGSKKTVVIVAGGKGLRMKSDIPKQFLALEAKPVLMHSIEAFYSYDPDMDVVVVLPELQVAFWENLCREHCFSIPCRIVNGGETRFHSVKNALEVLRDTQWVAVHDAVRPLVDVETIARCFDAAEKHRAVVPVIEAVDSMRQLLQDGTSRSVDRAAYRLVQTPQVFAADLLKKAYEQDFSPLFTDDASVVEACGEDVILVEGARENIKITTPMDVALAESIIRNRC